MQTLSQSIGQYLEMCEYERNLSADTLKAYRIDLRQFSEFAGHEWADRDLLNRYIEHLNQTFAPRSVKRNWPVSVLFIMSKSSTEHCRKTHFISFTSAYRPLNSFRESYQISSSMICCKVRTMIIRPTSGMFYVIF